MPLAACNLGAIQPTADLYFDSLGTEPQRLFNRFAHRAPKRDSFFKLRCDLLSLQLCVQLRFVNLGAPAADDDARPRSVDDDLQAIRRALNVNVRHARAGEALLQFALQP